MVPGPVETIERFLSLTNVRCFADIDTCENMRVSCMSTAKCSFMIENRFIYKKQQLELLEAVSKSVRSYCFTQNKAMCGINKWFLCTKEHLSEWHFNVCCHAKYDITLKYFMLQTVCFWLVQLGYPVFNCSFFWDAWKQSLLLLAWLLVIPLQSHDALSFLYPKLH